MKRQGTVAIDFLPDGSSVPMDFGRLIEVNNVSVSDLAEWCNCSRAYVYNLINGRHNPIAVSYVHVTNFATFLDEEPVVVYNAIVESYESKRIWCETLGKWMLPEEIIEVNKSE